MPLRALGYVASAVRLADAHLPRAVVQMVHTLHTARRVNGVDIVDVRKQARRFADATSRVLDGLPDVTHLVDPIEPIVLDRDAVMAAIEGLPTHAKDKLARAGKSRGDSIDYVAAHVQMHDTAAQLVPLRSVDVRPQSPKRIISIGAQSERPFYLARMACRTLGVEIPDRVEETAQLFTRHVLPPYYMCREGEPHIDQLYFGFETDEASLYATAHPNPSVARDLGFVGDFLRSLPAGVTK